MIEKLELKREIQGKINKDIEDKINEIIEYINLSNEICKEEK